MDLEGQLALLSDSLPARDASVAVDTLLRITQNALANPRDENVKRIRTANKVFQQRVWRHWAAQEFLRACGWVEVDDCVVLTSESRLQEALEELAKSQSLLEPVPAPPPPPPSQPPPSSHKTGSAEHTERMRKLREEQRKVEAEKKRIAEQIRADRQETGAREAKPSHGRPLQFGSNLNRFEDIGVDLNSGGG